MSRGFKSLSHLARNLVLSHDHGFEACGDREKVLGDRGSDSHAHHVADVVVGKAGCIANQLGDVINAVMKEIGLDIELNPVAGGEPHGTSDGFQGCDFASDSVCRIGDGIKRLQGQVMMTRTDEDHDHTQQDTCLLDNVPT
jgi:hypothetical protein